MNPHKRFEQATALNLRVLQVADLGTLLATDAFESHEPDAVQAFLDDAQPGAHRSVEPIYQALDTLGHESMHEVLYQGGFHGLLMLVATPLRKHFSKKCSTYSWSNYYTGWVYGATYEQAWKQAVDWAESRHAADLDKFLKVGAA